MTNNYQQADTGTKMIHIGRGTKSRIVSKGISAGHSQNSYRGLVRMNAGATGARNFSQCDSLLIGSHTCFGLLQRSAVYRQALVHGLLEPLKQLFGNRMP